MDIGHPGGPQDTQSTDGFGWNAVFTEDNTVVVESLYFVLSPDNHLYVMAVQSPGDDGFQQVTSSISPSILLFWVNSGWASIKCRPSR